MTSAPPAGSMVARARRLFANDFLRSVLVLAGGASVGQGLLILALPIATRLYDPAAFGVFAVFNAIVGIGAVAACLRYDIAVPMPERDRDADDLLAIALACAVLSATTLALALTALPSEWLAAVFEPGVATYLAFAPLSIFLMGAVSAFQHRLIRDRAFPAIARARIAQSGAQASVQIGLGVAQWGPIGLVLAQMANAACGATLLGLRALRAASAPLGDATESSSEAPARRSLHESAARRLALMREYRRFAIYSTPEALFNAAGIFLPVILIGALAPAAEAGYLLLAMYAMQATMSLVGTAIGQVYLSRAPLMHREGRLGAYTLEVLGNLARVGVGPLLFIGLVAPVAFGFVFGAGWERAGVLVAWMTPWFVAQFLASPVSMSLHVTGNQRQAMLLQFLGLLLRPGAVLLAFAVAPTMISEAYALSGLVFYGIYLAVVARALGISMEATLLEICRNWQIFALWGLGSISIVSVICWVGF